MILSMLADWASLLVRWTHVMAGIAWIGSSFYFIALDASLKHNDRLDPRVKGEAWQVHGGGFYQMQKFLVAPEFLPRELTWFKWEAYSTWIFGFTLLVLVYYLNPGLYLIDPAIADIGDYDAVAVGAGSLLVGWLLYDGLCRSWIGRETIRLAVCGFILLVAAAYGYTHVFSGRAAFIQTGALVATIMAGNVFFVIIPNQKKVVADMIAGRTPPAWLGAQAKQRSVHNNYLTLPVVFTMLSNHYAFTFQSHLNWLILACVFVAGFLVRHWFNLHHAGLHPDWRLWPAAAVPLLVVAAINFWEMPRPAAAAGNVSFADVQHIIGTRCAVCHSAHPTNPAFTEAPKGVRFDTPGEITARAPQIYAQAVATSTMPLNNITEITPEERQKLAAWIAAGARR